MEERWSKVKKLDSFSGKYEQWETRASQELLGEKKLEKLIFKVVSDCSEMRCRCGTTCTMELPEEEIITCYSVLFPGSVSWVQVLFCVQLACSPHVCLDSLLPQSSFCPEMVTLS